MLIRARVVHPLCRPAIGNGAVRVVGNAVQSVGAWRAGLPEAGEEVIDLGDVVVLPGLVNAHCHLDYTAVGGQVAATRSFTDWIKSMLAARAGWLYADFAHSWLSGAAMLVRTGTTTVADVESAPELLPDAWQATPLRVFSFLEMTGVKSGRDPAMIVREALDKLDSLAGHANPVGLSPHAPYSTHPALLRQSAVAAKERGLRLVTHVAESDVEFEMFTEARGDLFDWLGRNGRDMGDCGQGSPVAHLARNELLGGNLLAVHANYLAAGDADLLGRSGASVVHCPRSHAFFGHRPFPREELDRSGVRVCLGTDSLATVRAVRAQPLELNLFAEMRAARAADPSLGFDRIVRMATLDAAGALGMSGRAGELGAGSFADLIALPFTGDVSEVCEAVVHHPGDVAASMIRGQWAIPPGAS